MLLLPFCFVFFVFSVLVRSLNLTLAAFGVEVLAVILSTIALFQKRRTVTQGNVTMQRIPSSDK